MIHSRSPAVAGWHQALDARLTVTEPIPGFVTRPAERLPRPPFSPRYLEECRRVLFNILGSHAEHPRVIAVVSAERGEGRSYTAAGVAYVAAQDTGSSVLLADLDLEQPRLSTLFGVDPSPGWAEYVQGYPSLRVMTGGPGGRLGLLPGGERAAPPAHLLQQLISSGMVDACRDRFGLVILDLPPLLESPEAVQLAAQTEAHLVVGRYRYTTLASVRRVCSLLDESGRRPSFVLVGQRSRIPGWARRLI